MADKHTTEKLLEGDRLSGKVTLFAKVTILPGDELSYHEHHGEDEVKNLDTMIAKDKISFPITNSWYIAEFDVPNWLPE